MISTLLKTDVLRSQPPTRKDHLGQCRYHALGAHASLNARKFLHMNPFKDTFEDMSWAAAVLMLATGVFLPTSDVYSDLFFVGWLFHGNYYAAGHRPGYCERREEVVPPHPRFGSVMLIPLLLSWILVTRQWYIMERGMKQKLKMLPLLILQVYPQWMALQVLYYAKWRKHRGWQKMKEDWETGITHIGKYEVMFE